jgi:hypothetical protein
LAARRFCGSELNLAYPPSNRGGHYVGTVA